MGTGGPSSPGYTHTPYFSSQQGAFPANLQDKSTAQAPFQSSSHCSNPRRSFCHCTWGCAAQTLCTCPATPNLTHPPHTHLPARGTSQILPWFLSHLGFFVPRTSSSLTPAGFHTAPASSVDAPAENGAVPALSATAALGQAGKSTFPAVDEATG